MTDMPLTDDEWATYLFKLATGKEWPPLDGTFHEKLVAAVRELRSRPAPQEVAVAVANLKEIARVVKAGLHAAGRQAVHDDALKAASLLSRMGEGWRPIAEAPRDGTHILAVVEGQTRRVAWGKTSHIPLYGFCLADQGAEDFDLCEPTLWQHLPKPPEGQ